VTKGSEIKVVVLVTKC